MRSTNNTKNVNNSIKITYLVWYMGICGGTKIIYEHANRLSKKNFSVNIIGINGLDGKDWFNFDKKIKFFKYQKKDNNEWIDQTDIAVATFNESFWHLIDLPTRIKKAYLVQTNEKNFYEPNTSRYNLADLTYKIQGVHFITIAEWLKKWLKNDYNQDAILIKNKVDRKYFFPDPDEKLKNSFPKDKKIVILEGDVNSTKKGVQDAYKAIENLDCTKWLITNANGSLPEYTKHFDKIFRHIHQDKMRQVLSSGDILVKASHFEGSPLTHIEAMCCGLGLITTDCTGVSEYCKDRYNSLIVPVKNIKAIRNATKRLLINNQLLTKLKRNSLEYAENYLYDWQTEIDKLAEVFQEINSKPDSKAKIPLNHLTANIAKSLIELDNRNEELRKIQKSNLWTKIKQMFKRYIYSPNKQGNQNQIIP